MSESFSEIVTLAQVAASRMKDLLYEQAGALEDCRPNSVRQRFSFECTEPFADQLQDRTDALASPLGQVYAFSSAGGPFSKYGNVNEDSYSILATDNLLFVGLIDGAGGSQDGSVASRVGLLTSHTALMHFQANQTVGFGDLDTLREQDLTQALLRRPTRELLQLSKAQSAQNAIELDGAYGTVAGIVRTRTETTEARTFIYAWGDARVIQLRGAQLIDEGTTWFMNQAGYDAAKHADPTRYWKDRDNQYQLLVALGSEPSQDDPIREEDIGVREVIAQSKDTFVLLTDGVADLVTDYELLRLARFCLAPDGRIDAQLLQERICRLATLRNATRPGEAIWLQLSAQEQTPVIINHREILRSGRSVLRCEADNQTVAVIQIP